jgi:glycosidase
VIDKLDYIHSLGANTLYLTPIFLASSNHKYDTADYRRIDPAFGDEALFEKLCREAAKRGMRVLPDASFNHVGQDSLYFDRFGNYGGQGAFANGQINRDSPYYDWFHFDASQAQPDKQYTGWVGIPDLPEIDKSSPAFRRFVYGDADSVTRHWLARGASGWRMDVAPWVPDDFWREWRAAVKAQDPQAITVAEAWFDASKFLLGDTFDSTMNYVFRNSVLDYARGGDARAAYRNLELLRENYPPQALHALMNLLSTHDTARSLHLLGYADGETDAAKIALAKQRFRLALFFQFTYPGAPALFYGDEVGLTGGDDPYNRGTYPWADLGGAPDVQLLEYVRSLGQLRREHPVLARGSLDAPLYLDEHVVVLLRRAEGAWALTTVNNGAAPAKLHLQLPSGAPREFRDGISDVRHLADAAGWIELEVPATSGIALVYDARTALR